jgi:hypothetical protein
MQAPPNGRFTPSEPDDQGYGGDVVDTVQWNTAINRVAGVGNVVGGMVTVRVAPVFLHVVHLQRRDVPGARRQGNRDLGLHLRRSAVAPCVEKDPAGRRPDRVETLTERMPVRCF